MTMSAHRRHFAPHRPATRCYRAALVRTLDGGAHDLEARSTHQFVDPDKRPCGKMPVKVAAVDIVERTVQSKVGTEHLDPDEILLLVTGCFDRVLDGLHHQPGFE